MRKKIFTILAFAAFCLFCDTEPEKEYVPPCRHPSFWSDYFAEEETLKDFIFYTRSAGENLTFHFAYSSLPEINGYNRDGFSFLGFSTGKAGGIITRRRTRSRSMNTMTSFAIMGNHPSTLAPRIISNAASLPSSAS